MKKPLQSLFAAATVAAMSGLIACGDDNPTGPGKTGTIGENDTSTASALALGLVTPLMRNMFLQEYLDQVLSPGTGVAPAACNPLDICSSGSAEYCSDPGMLQVNFTECALAGTSLDGSVSLALEQGSGSGTFTLTVGGDFNLAGDISYAVDPDLGCFSQSFTNVVMTTGCDGNRENCAYTIQMNGYAEWCDPVYIENGFAVPRYADFFFTIPALNRLVNVTVYDDPNPGFMQVLVQDQNYTILLLCDGNITGGGLECTSDVY